MARVDIELRQRATGGQAASGVVANVNKLMGALKNAAVGAAAFGVTLKKAFDIGEEGMALKQLEQSFDLLNKTVLHTPDVLEKMRDASNHTLKDVDMMRGVLTMTAGVSDNLAAAFGQAAPTLMEYAKAANKLNPALGDTAFMFDSIAKGIKRGSPLILDNLGIVIEIQEANKKYAKSLGITTNKLTAEQKQFALLNEVMMAGDQLLAQVGGNTEALQDPFAQLTAKVGMFTDSLKTMLGEALLPAMKAMSGDYTRDIARAAESQLMAADSTKDYTDALRRWGETIDESRHLSGGYRDALSEGINPAIREAALELMKTTESAKEFDEALFAASGSSMKTYTVLLEALGLGLGETGVQFYELEKAKEAQNDIDARMIEQQEHMLAVQQPIIEKQKISLNIFKDFLMEFRAGQKEYKSEKAEEYWTAVRDGITEARDAASDARVAFNGMFQSALNDGSELLVHNIEDLGTSFVRAGGLTGEQADELERLQGIYDRSAMSVRDYELGLKGVNLEDDARVKKIGELQTLMDNATAAMQPFKNVQGELVEVTKSLVFDEQALTQELMNQVSVLDASPQVMMQLATATGVMSKAQIDAAYKAALMTQKIEAVAKAVAEGELSVRDGIQALQDFAVELDKPYKATLLVDDEEGLTKLKNFALKLDEINGRTVRARVDVDGELQFGPEAPEAGHGSSQDKDGSGRRPRDYETIGGFQPGLHRGGTVGMGGTFLTGESGPEKVFLPSGARVQNNESLQNFGGGGGITVSGDIILQVQAAAGEDVSDLTDKLLEEIGSRVRATTNSGASLTGVR